MTEAFLLLHGFTGAPSSWDEVVRLLPRDVRVLRPALLGHGGPHTTGFDAEVDRIAAIVRAERLERAHVVGYSLGARIAIGLAARHPELAARATWISASPGMPGDRARIAADEARAVLLEQQGTAAFVDAWEREPTFATQHALPPEIRAAHRARRLAHDPRGLAASLRTLGQGAMPAYDLASIGIPVTLVVGSEDGKARGHALRMVESLPRARTVVVRGAGHDVVLERPAEVAALLSREIGT
jgi:2-succinyl-6-hydroxy-2,4-cyclohexadiene-1-carboxylate synthase